ncbi:MAG: caspase family protein [Bacteroidales bacterium]
MKSRILIGSLFVFMTLSGFSQSNYYDYNENQKTEIFVDNFIDNRNNWIIEDNTKHSLTFVNNKYILKNKNENIGWDEMHQDIAVDINADFEIEYKAKYNYTNIYSVIMLFFGESFTTSNTLSIGGGDFNCFSGGPYGKYTKYTNGNYLNYSIDYSSFNTYTIRKVNSKIYVFFNSNFIFESSVDIIPIKQVGFMLSNHNSIEINYLNVSYLSKQPKVQLDNIAPEISITYPNILRGFKPVEQQNRVTITGKATDASGIFEILINGEPASVDAQGNFSKTVLLAFGDNSFTVKASDIKQNISTETFVIERKSSQQDVVVVNNQTSNSGNLQAGKYYALIIGNNNYSDPAINSLDEPINDATKLYNVLTAKYTFEPQNITFIKDATYVQMIEALDNISNKITENDNLLVFYAGHGWWDDDKKLGYWLPTNAKKSSTAFWIRNSTISDYMSSIKTKHTLLIADACFSGSIFKTRSAFSDAGQAINSLYKLPSRTAMTSGNLKEVPDKSVFLEYLVKRLDNNTEKYLSSDQLFASFRIAVMNNSKTEPQFGTIQNAGDEGGEFIFIKK